MPLFPKINGSHKEMTDCKVKVGGEWKQAVEMLVKVNGKWKTVFVSNFIDLSVVHVTTARYEEFEDTYESVPNYAAFVGLEMSVYNSNGELLSRETLGTNEEPEIISSASYSLYDDDNMYATVSVYVDKLNSAIRYTISREAGSSAAKIEIKVAKILAV